MCWIAWKIPIRRPNCLRSLTVASRRRTALRRRRARCREDHALVVQARHQLRSSRCRRCRATPPRELAPRPVELVGSARRPRSIGVMVSPAASCGTKIIDRSSCAQARRRLVQTIRVCLPCARKSTTSSTRRWHPLPLLAPGLALQSAPRRRPPRARTLRSRACRRPPRARAGAASAPRSRGALSAPTTIMLRRSPPPGSGAARSSLRNSVASRKLEPPEPPYSSGDLEPGPSQFAHPARHVVAVRVLALHRPLRPAGEIANRLDERALLVGEAVIGRRRSGQNAHHASTGSRGLKRFSSRWRSPSCVPRPVRRRSAVSGPCATSRRPACRRRCRAPHGLDRAVAHALCRLAAITLIIEISWRARSCRRCPSSRPCEHQ